MARKASGRTALRKWRLAQEPKVTQDDLGKAVGVSGSYIRRYEIGKQDLPLDLKVRLAAHTGIALVELLSAAQLDTASQAAGLLGAPSESAA